MKSNQFIATTNDGQLYTLDIMIKEIISQSAREITAAIYYKKGPQKKINFDLTYRIVANGSNVETKCSSVQFVEGGFGYGSTSGSAFQLAFERQYRANIGIGEIEIEIDVSSTGIIWNSRLIKV
jgi:hypothetical protein